MNHNLLLFLVFAFGTQFFRIATLLGKGFAWILFKTGKIGDFTFMNMYGIRITNGPQIGSWWANLIINRFQELNFPPNFDFYDRNQKAKFKIILGQLIDEVLVYEKSEIGRAHV